VCVCVCVWGGVNCKGPPQDVRCITESEHSKVNE